MLAICNRTVKTKDYSNIGCWFVFKDQGGGQCFALCVVEPGLGYPGGLRSSFTSKFTTLTQVQRHMLIKWQTPHTFQQSMLSKSTPVLLHTISNFEMFMTDWETNPSSTTTTTGLRVLPHYAWYSYSTWYSSSPQSYSRLPWPQPWERTLWVCEHYRGGVWHGPIRVYLGAFSRRWRSRLPLHQPTYSPLPSLCLLYPSPYLHPWHRQRQCQCAS